MVNCMPVFIASDQEWADKFRAKKLPIVGDDIKSQLGATIVHRTLAQLFSERLGAVPVGERLSPSIPGRALPLLAVPLRRTAGGSVGAARAGYWR